MVPPSTGLPDPATTTLGERFLELTTDVAGAIDFEGRVVGANPALLRTGASPVGELANLPAAQILHPDDLAALGVVWRDLVSGVRDSARIEVRLGPTPPERRWFLMSLVVDRDAELVYLIGKDIHESRLASDQLGDAEARFRSAFDRSGVGMTITGLDARYLQVNEAFARMVGRSVAELTGRPGRGHLAPRRRRRRPRPDPRPHRQPGRDRRAREALRPARRLDRPRQP